MRVYAIVYTVCVCVSVSLCVCVNGGCCSRCLPLTTTARPPHWMECWSFRMSTFGRLPLAATYVREEWEGGREGGREGRHIKDSGGKKRLYIYRGELTISFATQGGSLHVRVRRDADEQVSVTGCMPITYNYGIHNSQILYYTNPPNYSPCVCMMYVFFQWATRKC